MKRFCCVTEVILALILGVYSQLNCPAGWRHHGGKCYTFINAPYTWFDARVACDAVGGRIAEIMSQPENAFITSMLQALNGSSSVCRNLWIGLEDFVVDGQFTWQGSKEVPEYSNWKPGEPNNAHGNEGCVELDCSGRWNDANCETAHFPFVCESSDVGDIIGK